MAILLPIKYTIYVFMFQIYVWTRGDENSPKNMIDISIMGLQLGKKTEYEFRNRQ